MIIRFTELILTQTKTLVVMMACGIAVETLWQLKKILQGAAVSTWTWVMEEILFWAASGAALSMFLYYSAFGEISFHAMIGFLTGLLLWKKICCGIISSWEKRDAADNLKATARSSTWTRQEKNVRKKGVKKKNVRRKKNAALPASERQAKWPSEDRKTEEDF